MFLYKYMEVSFGASIKGSTYIKRFVQGKSACMEKAVVYELNPKSFEDWYALEVAADNFSKNNTKANYAINIKDEFNTAVNNGRTGDNQHFYVLTLNNSNPEHLGGDDILGVFLVEDKLKLSEKRKKALNVKTDYVTKIRFLQSSPKHYFDNKNKSLSGIGNAIINFIKETFNEYDILVKSDKRAIKFYESNGYKKCMNNLYCDMLIKHAN